MVARPQSDPGPFTPDRSFQWSTVEPVHTSGGSRRSDKGGGDGGGRGRSSRPWDKGGGGGAGAVTPKKFFRPFKPQFGLKIRGGGPPGPSPKSATAQRLPWGQKKVTVVERWPFWRGATATGIWIWRCFGASARTNNDNENDNDSDGVW